jgi:pre-rRNA-processing protein TSR1
MMNYLLFFRTEDLERFEKQRDELEFPDEVDTPKHMSAKDRFQRYRGLKSFRTSPWDPLENLPDDYGRIYQFKNFRAVSKRILAELEHEESEIAVGSRVELIIKDAPRNALDHVTATKPLILHTLLPFEEKVSLMNFVANRPTPNGDNPYMETDTVVRSKDVLLFQCGFRKYVIRPIFSTNTRGGSNNVHKMERFLLPGRSSIGSAYLPIQLTNTPTLLFKVKNLDDSVAQPMGENVLPIQTYHLPITSEQVPILISTGSTLNMDPNRIIAKRIILTGHPFKIHKRGAVVRFMFFNPQDIAWFKPVQLCTKLGRIGHIKESLGTKGHMKCVFDGPLKQNDTVCMYLYKRVFPKWNAHRFCYKPMEAIREE